MGATAAQMLAEPRDGYWHWTRSHWSEHEKAALRVLCDANAPLEKSANYLMRSPTSIAHRAQTDRLSLPPEWAKLIAPKRKPIVLEPRVQLSYPFIIKKRDEHSDLLAVNRIVPQYIPGREDICQEIMLAMWEGTITVQQLEANRHRLREFVKSFKLNNFEMSGYAVSLDAPVRGFDDLRLIDTFSTDDSLWAHT